MLAAADGSGRLVGGGTVGISTWWQLEPGASLPFHGTWAAPSPMASRLQTVDAESRKDEEVQESQPHRKEREASLVGGWLMGYVVG